MISARSTVSLCSRVGAAVAALAAGAVIGALAPLLDGFAGPAGHAAHLVLDAGWSWAALAFCVGLARRSRIESAVLAWLSLPAAVTAYYLTKLAQGAYVTVDLADPAGGTPHADWPGALSKIAVWCVAACLFGPLCGLAGNLARNAGFRGLPFRVLVPLVAIAETTMRLRYEAALQAPATGVTWSVIRLVAVGAIVLLAGCAVVARRSGVQAGPAPR
ncbi:hypothetical protein ADL22_32115 [Streptomyces sp. NRRL F-4489]|nr:hypothetical protein ADL22_32115 [Streptomyces sp. NRRL F-4489]